jgi:hypothetical protein
MIEGNRRKGAKSVMVVSDDENPVVLLFVAHFGPCDLIYQHYMEARGLFYSNTLQEEVGFSFISYMHLWMALLYVVADGFKELQLKDPKVNALLDAHLDELRVFRNSVFHYQKTDRKRVGFHGVSQFNWAQDLHGALRDYFTSLRGQPAVG